MDELLTSVVEAARLAPSTYNTQPWRFVRVRSPELLAGLRGEASEIPALLLVEETHRRLPYADPAGAETLLSLGACLANVVLASEAAGRRARVVLVDRDVELSSVLLEERLAGTRAVALVRFDSGSDSDPHDPPSLDVYLDGMLIGPTTASSPVAEASVFERRRSERGPYAARPLPRPVLDRAASSARRVLASLPHQPLALFITTDPESVARARRLLRRSIRSALSVPAVVREAAAWFPPSRERARQRGDGEPLDAAGWSGVELWLARRALHPRLGPLLMRLGGAGHVARRYSKNVTESAGLLCWASLPETASPWESVTSRELCFLPAGGAIEGAWLSLTADGAGLQFMTACAVSSESRRELADVFGLPLGYAPLSVQRCGYPDPPSTERPIRRRLEQLLDIA